jgi:SLAP domain-containing protein
MQMFSFFKNWLNKEQGKTRSVEELKKDIQEDAAVDFAELSEQEAEVEAGEDVPAAEARNQKVRTDLSLHPAWEQQLDNEKKYTLRFLQAQLPDVPAGSISVTGFSLIPNPEGLTVAMFVRNGLDRPVRFKDITLAIYLDDKPFARQRVDLSGMGSIPPRSSRPWEVFFPEGTYLHENFSFTRWKVMMKAQANPYVWPNHLDLDPQMEARMTERQKDRLELLIHSLPPIEAESVEATGFDIGWTKKGELVVAVLFRNGLPVDYRPDQLKITVSDTEGDVVATGVIDGSSIRVRPGTSRPWLFVFPANAVKKPNASLKRWVLEVT